MVSVGNKSAKDLANENDTADDGNDHDSPYNAKATEISAAALNQG